MKLFCSTIFALIFTCTAVAADLRAIVIDPSLLPYSLSPDKYTNSPTKYANSSTTYDNAATTYSNSASTYKNSSTTYGNGINGDRRLYDNEGNYLGYYVFSDSGVLNIYSSKGRRFAYIPNADTQSIFFSDGGWCGTIAEDGGETVAAITSNCYLRLKLE